MSRASKHHRRMYKAFLRKKMMEGPQVWGCDWNGWSVSRYTMKGYEFVGRYKTKEQALFEVEFLKLLDEELSMNERDCSS